MVMVFFSPLRRWWQMNFGPDAEPSFAGAGARFSMPDPAPERAASWHAPRPAPLLASRPVLRPVSRPAPRRAARRFWMTLDPKDLRHAALGGSFAEVCAALEQLAAVEEHRA